MSTENEIRNVSEQFYVALNRMVNGDAGPLTDIWSHSAAVTTLQPSGGRQVGWDEVRVSWELVAQVVSVGRVKLRDQLIQVAREVAYELGTEQFSMTIGGWKIVHHHTDLSPAMLDVLSRLQAQTQESVSRS